MISKVLHLSLLLVPLNSPAEAAAKYGAWNSPEVLNHIVQFDWKPYGLDFQDAWVNKDIVVPLTLVMDELKEKGMINELTTFKGCFNQRRIAGSARPSTHSWGLACDFNHIRYTPGFVEVWEKYSWCWGGHWNSWKDYMHFSWVGIDWECQYKLLKKKRKHTNGPSIQSNREEEEALSGGGGKLLFLSDDRIGTVKEGRGIKPRT